MSVLDAPLTWRHAWSSTASSDQAISKNEAIFRDAVRCTEHIWIFAVDNASTLLTHAS